MASQGDFFLQFSYICSIRISSYSGVISKFFSTPGSELVGLQRTTSSESGTGSVTDMSSRVGSLLGSIRAKTGQPASGGQQPQQQDPGELLTTCARLEGGNPG